ncbi:MAG: insulinase family protein [Rhodospirillales bacterium]|nr:insulinase family protein [Rhodospirillales bacterium]MDE2576943.1 insulinase family protein [Rhodospirillales bacterium]
MRIEQTRLASGLAVITAALPDFETAAVTVVVRAGSRDEEAENSGVAHFLEHMAFKGTATRSAYGIAMEVEQLGASINAFTSHEVTAYHIVGLRDVVEEGVAILGDVLTASRFAPEDVDLERGVIAQEIARNGDDPHALCVQGFLARAYPGQTLGRPVLGDPAFVARATREDMLGFIARHYGTGTMLVSAAGNVEHGWLCRLVERNFAAIPTTPPPPPRVPQRYGGGLAVHHREDFKQVNLVLGFPSVGMADPAVHAHRMLATALGGGMASPLFQEVRQKRGLVYGVGAGSHGGSDFGLLLVQAGMTPDKLDECLAVIGAELLRLTEAVQETDFTRARNAMLAQLATVKEKPFGLAFYLAEQFFRTGAATGPQPDLDAVRAVQIGDLRAAARQMFAAAPTLSMVGPVQEADQLAIVQRALAG